MVTLQILVLSFLVRVRVSQLESIFHSKDAFFLFIPQNKRKSILPCCGFQIRRAQIG